MELSKDVLEFIQLLNQKRVRYLVIGGWAVSLHSKPRFTKDIDILIHRVPENAFRMMEVIEAFGFSSLEIAEEDFLKPGFIIQLGVEPNRIDIITEVVGVTFSEAYQDRVEVRHLGTPISLISRKDLIANKEATGRDQDLVDVKALRKLEGK